MKRYLLYSLPIFITGIFIVSCYYDFVFIAPFLLPFFTFLLKPLGQFTNKEVWAEYLIFHHQLGFEYLRIIAALFFIGFNVWVAYFVLNHSMTWWNFAFLVYGVVIINSNFAIALAHDLMHSQFWFSRFLGNIILLINGFFYLQTDHIYIHHQFVGTNRDPASALKNVNVYTYLLYSIKARFLLLFVGEKPTFRPVKFFNNFWRLIVCILLLALAWYISKDYFWILFSQFVFVTLLYEVITYIQHYGLRRYRLHEQFQSITVAHSWNCFYKMSAYLYYMMPIHSLHHLKQLPGEAHIENVGPSFPNHFSKIALLAFFPGIFIPKMNTQIETLNLPSE